MRIYSKKYYFDGPQKQFPNQNSAQRQAEWKQKRWKEDWEYTGKLVSVNIIRRKDHFVVELHLT